MYGRLRIHVDDVISYLRSTKTQARCFIVFVFIGKDFPRLKRLPEQFI